MIFKKKYKEFIEVILNSKDVVEVDVSLKGGMNFEEFIKLFGGGNEIKEEMKQYYFHNTKLDDFPSYNEFVSNESYITDIIAKQSDHVTMFNSIEGRSPFMDYRLIELAKTIPHEISYKNSTSKYVLKKILSKHLPKEFWDRPKKGFSSPNKEWLKESFNKQDIYDTFSKFDFIEKKILEDLLREYQTSEYKYKNIVWRMYYFDKWFRIINKNYYNGKIT